MQKFFKKNSLWWMILIILLNLAVVFISYHFFLKVSRKGKDMVFSKGPGGKNAISDFDAQNSCAREADDFFKNFGCRNPESPEISEYRGHYNRKLGKCFVQIINGSPLCNRWNNIVEIFEVPSGKKIAAFIKILGDGRHYYDYPSVSCELLGDVCSSTSEYDNFVKSMIEN